MLFSDLEGRIALRAPQAALPLIRDAIRESVSDFCRWSTAWRQRYSTVAIIANKANYEISYLAEAPVCAVTDMRVKTTQAEITSATEAELNRTVPGWQLATGQTIKRYLAPERPDLIRLYPIPEVTGDHLDIQVAMYPGPETAEIPDWLGLMFFDDLVAGAVGVLLGMRGQPWANAGVADESKDALRAAAARARIKVEKSHTRTPVRAQFTSFDDL